MLYLWQWVLHPFESGGRRDAGCGSEISTLSLKRRKESVITGQSMGILKECQPKDGRRSQRGSCLIICSRSPRREGGRKEERHFIAIMLSTCEQREGTLTEWLAAVGLLFYQALGCPGKVHSCYLLPSLPSSHFYLHSLTIPLPTLLTDGMGQQGSG